MNLGTVPLGLFPKKQTVHTLMTCCRCPKHKGSFRISEATPWEFSSFFFCNGRMELLNTHRGNEEEL